MPADRPTLSHTPPLGASVVTPTSTASTARVVRSLRRSRLERRSAGIACAAVVGVWLLVVFAGALADASDQAARLAKEQAINDQLQARVAAGDAEIDAIAQRSFMDLLARGYGMGATAERPFSLAPGAPPPPVMVPLGRSTAQAPPTTPFEDWMRLLIGG